MGGRLEFRGRSPGVLRVLDTCGLVMWLKGQVMVNRISGFGFQTE